MCTDTSAPKTDVEAAIPFSAKLAADLENVPLKAGTSKDMPFRTQGLKLKLNQKVWSNRIGAVLDTAEVKWVDIPGRDKHGKPIRKAVNTKQFGIPVRCGSYAMANGLRMLPKCSAMSIPT
jgi:hypothetical protein